MPEPRLTEGQLAFTFKRLRTCDQFKDQIVARQTQDWIPRSHAERHQMRASVVLGAATLVLCLTGLASTDADSAQLSRQETSPSEGPAQLTQPEVLAVAKSTARKVVRQKIYDYEIKSVIFDSHAREWSVLFEQHPQSAASRGCLYVYVKDDTKDATVRPC